MFGKFLLSLTLVLAAAAAVSAQLTGRLGDQANTENLRPGPDSVAGVGVHCEEESSHPAQHHAQAAQPSAQPSRVTAEMRQQILRDREAVWRAWFTNDQAKLKQVIPEEAIAINAGEEAWENRDAILGGARKFAAGGAKLVSLEFPRTEIQMYGDTIILYTTYSYELEKDGKRTRYGGRGTEIFVMRGGTMVNTGWHLDSGS